MQFTVPIQPESIDTTNKVAAYLRKEIKRYWPDAHVTIVFEDEGETVEARIALPGASVPIIVRHRSGSDDDWYTFVN
jgi:hypothetical protein